MRLHCTGHGMGYDCEVLYYMYPPVAIVLCHFPLPPREFRRLGDSAGRLDDAKVRQGLEAIGFTFSDAERAEIERESRLSSTHGCVEVEKLLDLCRVSDYFEKCVTKKDPVALSYIHSPL